ncbi:aldo/keto reductase [uncultured Sphingomonas sp.]|uniref:aldo/keto reductase n=1 Tax=uncultured Sphingomonas sp. TaxID=158754 RepID=UPI0025CDC83B|nr:aldo/keto reductase [uncultured Sphingomonas sp.]
MKASLQRLGVDRVDILLMHDLDRASHGAKHVRHWHDATVGGGFRAMERLRSEGLVDAIRMGVNEVAVCEATLAHAISTGFYRVLIAGRYTLLDDSATPFLDRCHRYGVPVIAGGVFNSGILATGSTGGQTLTRRPPRKKSSMWTG